MPKHIVVAAGGTLETAMLPARLLSLRSDYGVEVTAVVSPRALEFVTLTALRGVTGRDVAHEDAQFDATSGEPMHLALRKADMLVLHPASARIIAESALGIVSCPVTRQFAFTPKDRIVIAPAIHAAMDKRLYEGHLQRLRDVGCTVIGGDDLHASWGQVETAVARGASLSKQIPAAVMRLDANKS